jgi:hypothetical protein
MNWWIRLGCFLTGWNYKVLCACSEASFKHLKRYTSALLILIIIWGITGWCFADRYIKTSWLGCALTAFTFIIIVIQIERQIILTIGKNSLGYLFRVLVAILMAMLSSITLDQIIFGDDIDKKMVEIREEQVTKQLSKRVEEINHELQRTQIEIDSLERFQESLNQEIRKMPTIPTVSTSTTYIRTLRPDSTYEEIPQRTVSTTHVENPRIRQVETNEKQLETLRKRQEEYIQKKIDAREDLRKELDIVGILGELEAMMEIVFGNLFEEDASLWERLAAFIFWMALFCFLLLLELFVVITKGEDCDYDTIVKYQRDRKKLELEELGKNTSLYS